MVKARTSKSTLERRGKSPLSAAAWRARSSQLGSTSRQSILIEIQACVAVDLFFQVPLVDSLNKYLRPSQPPASEAKRLCLECASSTTPPNQAHQSTDEAHIQKNMTRGRVCVVVFWNPRFHPRPD